MSEVDSEVAGGLEAVVADYVPVLFAFVWKQPARRPILVTELWRGSYRLIGLRGASDVGDEGDEGSPAVFSAGHATRGTKLKFKWTVWLLDHIDAMEAHVKVGGTWTKLKEMDAPGLNKKWTDEGDILIPPSGFA